MLDHSIYIFFLYLDWNFKTILNILVHKYSFGYTNSFIPDICYIMERINILLTVALFKLQMPWLPLIYPHLYIA